MKQMNSTASSGRGFFLICPAHRPAEWRHIVEGQHMAVAGGDEQVAILAWQGAQGRFDLCPTTLNAG